MRAYAGGDFDITGITVLGDGAPLAYERDDKSLRVKLSGATQPEFPLCLKVSTN
jgi:hypothetical protein